MPFSNKQQTSQQVPYTSEKDNNNNNNSHSITTENVSHQKYVHQKEATMCTSVNHTTNSRGTARRAALAGILLTAAHLYENSI